MQFIDEAKIFIKSGDGGDGITSFRREKFVERGGPDGGDGGSGGDIIMMADSRINTLLKFRYNRHFKAQSGKNGQSANKTGRSAEDIIIYVPVGTQLFFEQDGDPIIDFVEDNEAFVVLKGGHGGLGNSNFKSSVNQAPTKNIKGTAGEEKWIYLKLKVLSDVGIIGMPNAGKSTLLSKLTDAKPKIADYPFTTLSPKLGILKIDDFECVIADIPGLIQGASEGVGLGDRFLKHIERCKILLHLIDITHDDIIASYNVIRNELKLYSNTLDSKEEIIVLNKIELVDKEELDKKSRLLSEYSKKEVCQISCYNKVNISKLLNVIKDNILKNKTV